MALRGALNRAAGGTGEKTELLINLLGGFQVLWLLDCSYDMDN